MSGEQTAELETFRLGKMYCLHRSMKALKMPKKFD